MRILIFVVVNNKNKSKFDNDYCVYFFLSLCFWDWKIKLFINNVLIVI